MPHHSSQNSFFNGFSSLVGYCCYAIIIIIIMMACCPMLVSSQQATYSLGTVMLDTFGPQQTEAFRRGMYAALKKHNDSVSLGKASHYLKVDTPSVPDLASGALNLTNIAGAVKGQINNSNIIAWFGMARLESVLATLPHIEAAHALLFGPMAGVPNRTFNQHIAQIRPSFADEIKAVINYLVTTKFLVRIAIVHMNDFVGREIFSIVLEALTYVGVPPCSILPVAGPTNDTDAMAKLLKASNPQAVFITGYPNWVPRFIKAYQDLDPTVIWTGHSPMRFSFQSLVKLAGGKPDTFVFPVNFPLTNDLSYLITENFQKDMDEVFGPVTDYSDPFTSIAFEYYISVKALAQVISGIRNPTRESVVSALFDGVHLFSVDDLILGPFSGTCPSRRRNDGMDGFCECNQGLRRIHLVSLDQTFRAYPLNSTFNFPLASCHASNNELQRPVVFTQLYTPNATSEDVSAIIIAGADAAAANQVKENVVVRIFRHPKNGTFEETIEVLRNKTAVKGVIASLICEQKESAAGIKVPRIGVMQLQNPQVEIPFQRHEIQVMASLDHEMFALAAHFSQSSSSNIHLLVEDTVSQSVLDAFGKSAMTHSSRWIGYRFSHRDSTSSPSLGALFSSLNAAYAGPVAPHFIMLIGVQPSDTSAMISYLTTHTNVVIAMRFLELATAWDDLVNLPSNISSRILFATSLPPWGNVEKAKLTHPQVAEFLAQYDLANPPADKKHHPFTMFGYFTIRVALFVIERIAGIITEESFLNTLYRIGFVFLDGVQLGPFSDCSTTDVELCCNNGITHVQVYNVSGMMDGSATVHQAHFPECDKLPYRIPPEKHLNLVLAVIIISPPVIICLLIAYCVLRKKESIDNQYAPKLENQSIVIIFTDIECNSALWGRFREVMASAIDRHHMIVRQLIRKHQLYEVKTLGDSFMIATSDPKAALSFAVEVQCKLYDEKWGTAAFDHFYREHGEDFSLHEIYCCKWNGLRMRVALDYGSAEIRFDEVSGRYDYFGPVVNTASRIENVIHGGQIVSSWAFRAALRSRTSTDSGGGESTSNQSVVPPSSTQSSLLNMDPNIEVADLGKVQLRGIEKPMALLQFLPLRLGTRIFPPLKALVEREDFMGVGMLTGSEISGEDESEFSAPVLYGRLEDSYVAKHSLSQREGISKAAIRYVIARSVELIEDLLSALSDRAKDELLKKLAAAWHVPVPTSTIVINSSAARMTMLHMVSRISETRRSHVAIQEWSVKANKESNDTENLAELELMLTEAEPGGAGSRPTPPQSVRVGWEHSPAKQ